MRRLPMPPRRTPMRRTRLRPVGRRGQARGDRLAQVRHQVAFEAGYRCQIETVACDGWGSQAHHLLPRSAGGSDDRSNLVWVCLPCHAHIHSHPADAYDMGWLRRRGEVA